METEPNFDAPVGPNDSLAEAEPVPFMPQDDESMPAEPSEATPETPEPVAATPEVSHEAIVQAAQTLSQLKPGALPLEIFIEMARLTVTPILEVVPLRTNSEGKVQVLLLERDADDPIWAGMLHTPGTVIRASDEDEQNAEAFDRVLQGELNGTPVSSPVFVGSTFHKVKRGTEQAQINYVEVVGEPTQGTFYDIDNLPDNLIDSQRTFIERAAAAYAEQERP